MISVKLKTYQRCQPVTLGEMKAQLRIELDMTDDDDLISRNIKAATNYYLNRTGRQLTQATWLAAMDTFTRFQELPYAPLLKVNHITYYDSNNALQTLSSSEYRINTFSEPGVIDFFGNMPTVYDRQDAIIIEYVAGYGADGDDEGLQQEAVPDEDKQIIMILAADMYEHRSENTGETVMKFSTSVDQLISERRVFTKTFYEHAQRDRSRKAGQAFIV